MTEQSSAQSETFSKQSITRKQFLSTLGVAFVGLLIPSIVSVTKKNEAAASYGNSSYGGKS